MDIISYAFPKPLIHGVAGAMTQPCIGMDNCQKAKRNSVGRLMCMSHTNGQCSSKAGPIPKSK